MRLEHAVIIRFFTMVIVPIGKRDVFGHAGAHLLGNVYAPSVILPVTEQAEEHIAPHMRLEAVFFRDLRNLVEMSFQQFEAIGKAVLVEISSKPYHMRLVHADIDVAAGEIFREGRKQFIDKRIRLFLVDQQNVVYVGNLPETRQLYGTGEMREGLDTRNQLDPVRRRVQIQFLELRARIAPAQISEIRLAFHLEGVLRIKLQRVIPHFLQTVDHALHRFGLHNPVSRTV